MDVDLGFEDEKGEMMRESLWCWLLVEVEVEAAVSVLDRGAVIVTAGFAEFVVVEGDLLLLLFLLALHAFSLPSASPIPLLLCVVEDPTPSLGKVSQA